VAKPKKAKEAKSKESKSDQPAGADADGAGNLANGVNPSDEKSAQEAQAE